MQDPVDVMPEWQPAPAVMRTDGPTPLPLALPVPSEAAHPLAWIVETDFGVAGQLVPVGETCEAGSGGSAE